MNNHQQDKSKRHHAVSHKPYAPPVLLYFGTVTELTNSAVGSCQDDSETNVCPPNKAMQMQEGNQ